ncbi:putative periodic tryptophan protein [Phaeomoniella chlamydospora]|uniref:Putative periodic tryptophan protein n=1 Tax=Phaeomoniella chlamydospora TaxID=158046 RepID=A0A0G2E7V2_PHACM|nr:putative periodic tryptophan protein [Phaeomoniella chlamydospora]
MSSYDNLGVRIHKDHRVLKDCAQDVYGTGDLMDETEIGRISKLAQLQLEDAQEELEKAKRGEQGSDEEVDEDVKTGPASSSKENAKDDDDLKEYNLDGYDNEEVDEEGEKFTRFGNVKSLAYHAPGEEDPYLTIPQDEASDDEEREELQILGTDNLLLAAKVEDEVAHLEVYVYEDEADNLYVHHDIMLPAIPLAVEWVDLPVGKQSSETSHGNFVAIATMDPDIEVWDLDVVDSMYPNAILGQGAISADESIGVDSKKKRKKRKTKVNDEYHVDAVLALAANRQHRNLLASASADKTVKLWDLNTGKCAKSYSMHKDKVCSLDWHPTESTVLLSGSYDQTVIATDMRAPEAVAPQWSVGSDVETVRWNPHDPNFFFVTTESGMVLYFDASAGSGSKPVWTLQAHDGAVSSFDVNPVIPGFLVTGSDDKTVKLWNVQDNKPSMVVSRNVGVGRVFSTRFAPDSEVGFRLAVAGSKGQLQVWDTSTNAAIRKVFANRVSIPLAEKQERFVRAADDDSESDDEDGGVETGEAGEQPDGWESMDED